MTSLRLQYAARSDVGLRRPGNEDSGFVDDNLLLVADGMGGYAAGELASAMAVATFAEIAAEPVSQEDLLEHLADGVDQLTERIGDIISAEPSNQGMGTTVTGLARNGSRMVVFHVGDSRAYLLRDDQLAQITKDHTYVQSLVDAGEITPEEARHHPRRNLVSRAVDGMRHVEADLSVRETRVGDRFLLCSDGLSGVVSDAELAAVLQEVADPTAAVTRLVDMALEAGAPDNVTVVVADLLESDETEDETNPVVVGAAGEPANRAKLPNVPWPVDEQPDPEQSEPRRTDPPPPTPSISAPGREHQANWLKIVLVVGATLLTGLAIVGVALVWWISQQWYVAPQDGQVAIYRGVEGNLGPIPLQQLHLVTDQPVLELPSYDQEQLRSGIETSSLSAAEKVVAELRQEAAKCKAKPDEPGCPGEQTLQ